MADSPRSPGAERRVVLDPKVAERLQHLTLTASRAVEGFLAGRHKSPHRGVSVEFVERRGYVPGDDLRHLDWKAFARTDRLAIKRYEEETNLECTLVVDASASMGYPTDGRPTKYDHAAQAAAALAHLILAERDGAALALFDHQLDRVLPASTSPAHLAPVLAALAERQPAGLTDLSVVLGRLVERIPRPGIVVVISDLFGEADTLAAGLARLRARNHDVIVLHVLHGDELRFPFDRLTRFEGLEEPLRLLVDPRSLREDYLAALGEWRAHVRRACTVRGVDYHVLDTTAPLDVALSAWLGARMARLARAPR
jgi:uncharacterized protein (DUF58 family)